MKSEKLPTKHIAAAPEYRYEEARNRIAITSFGPFSTQQCLAYYDARVRLSSPFGRAIPEPTHRWRAMSATKRITAPPSATTAIVRHSPKIEMVLHYAPAMYENRTRNSE